MTKYKKYVTFFKVNRLRNRLTKGKIVKTHGILNSDISRVLSYMRHTDTLCIGDCGLPCPNGTELIDIALDKNFPRFMDGLKIVLSDMKIEKCILAEELSSKNIPVHNEILNLHLSVPIEYVPHDTFKTRLNTCKAIIRTGEATPYANIILQSACIF